METLRHSIILSIAMATAISGSECMAQSEAKPLKEQAATVVAKIDETIVGEFRKAWLVAGGGVKEIEGVVLLYQRPDGTVMARSQGQTNQRRQFTLTLSSDVIAIVHTHPNNCFPHPNGADLKIAERFGIPVFTITNRGMFVYEPGAKRISKVKDGMRWLDPATWVDGLVLALNRE